MRLSRAGGAKPLGPRRKGDGESFSTPTLLLWCLATLYVIHFHVLPRALGDGAPAAAEAPAGVVVGAAVDARSLGELALAAQAAVARQNAEDAAAGIVRRDEDEEEEEAEAEAEAPQEQAGEEEEAEEEEAAEAAAEQPAQEEAPAPAGRQEPPAPPAPIAGGAPAAAAAALDTSPLGTWDDHPKKYLMLVQGQEGFGAWNDIVWEYLDLAQALGRTLVEPCVRNGCLEPCRCGHVTEVPDIHAGNLDEHFSGGRDPLNLKHIEFLCEPHTAWVHGQVGVTYPLSAYLDIRSLKAQWPHIVRYSDWCENVLKKDTSVKQDDGFEGGAKRWIMPYGYCAELHWHECYPQHAPKMIGDFVFTNITFGRGTDFDRQMEILQTDPSQCVPRRAALRPGARGRRGPDPRA